MPRKPAHRSAIVAVIQAAGETGISATEVEGKVECSLQQVYKDVKVLEVAGEVVRHGKSASGGDILVWSGSEISATLDNRSTGGKGVTLQPRRPGTANGSVSGLRLHQSWTVVSLTLEGGLTRVKLQDETGEILEFTAPS